MINDFPLPFQNTIEHFYDYNLAQFGVDVTTITTGGLVGLFVAGPAAGITYGLWAGTLITLESDKGSIATLMTLIMYSQPTGLYCSAGYIGGFFVGPVIGPALVAIITSPKKTLNVEAAGNALAGSMISTIPALTKKIGERWLEKTSPNSKSFEKTTIETELTTVFPVPGQTNNESETS